MKTPSRLFALLLVTVSASALDSFDIDWNSLRSYFPEPKVQSEIMIIMEAYGDLIDSIEIRRGDIAFHTSGGWIYYQDGRMLAESNLRNANRFTSLFYDNRIKASTDSPPEKKRSRRSHDFLKALFGTSESRVRMHCRTLDFLGHKINMNRQCVEPMKNIERALLEAARIDPEVEAFLGNLKVVYSFHRRRVKGSYTLSYHAYGLAVDLIPQSYQGKHVNWRWSASFVRRWDRIPSEKKWRPPQAVITAFEDNGFIWGGDWRRFDNVHFEFRPEIANFSSTLPTYEAAVGDARLGIK